MVEDPILAGYYDSVSGFFTLAKNEHLAKLTGRDFKSYDGRGFSVISTAWGRVETFRSLWPELASDPQLAVEPLELRRLAREDAIEEYDRQRMEDWALRMKLTKQVPA